MPVRVEVHAPGSRRSSSGHASNVAAGGLETPSTSLSAARPRWRTPSPTQRMRDRDHADRDAERSAASCARAAGRLGGLAVSGRRRRSSVRSSTPSSQERPRATAPRRRRTPPSRRSSPHQSGIPRSFAAPEPGQQEWVVEEGLPALEVDPLDGPDGAGLVERLLDQRRVKVPGARGLPKTKQWSHACVQW